MDMGAALSLVLASGLPPPLSASMGGIDGLLLWPTLVALDGRGRDWRLAAALDRYGSDRRCT